MAIKKKGDKVVSIFFSGSKHLITTLCCPIGSMSLVEETCCDCTYSFSVSGSIEAGCGGSNYYPNRCEPLNFQTAAITIGPIKFAVEISAGPGGITVDDELIVNGSVFQAGQYLVNLGGGCTGRTASSTPQCGGCERFGWTGTVFAPVASTCNGLHTIPEGTIIGTIPENETMTIAAGDNHGIDLFMSGQIVIKPLTAP
jgi:hypothetical protein